MIKIIAAQLNPLVGGVQEILSRILSAVIEAQEDGAAMIVFPELALSGYPPEDLLFCADFRAAIEQAMQRVQQSAQGIVVWLGHPHWENNQLYNAVSIFADQTLAGRYYKQHLPNTGVFDEQRYFATGQSTCTVKVAGIKFTAAICQDIWEPAFWDKPALQQGDVLVVSNASPFDQEKIATRTELVGRLARFIERPVIYVNQVGGQDDWVFDGGSFAVDSRGERVMQAPWFREAFWPVYMTTVNHAINILPEACLPLPSEPEQLYQAIVLATRDYAQKNQFKKLMLGLSGGLDSALTLAIAVDALGADAVQPVFMPSTHTGSLSRALVQAQCELLGLDLLEISIEQPFDLSESTLSAAMHAPLSRLTDQNLQARIRGLLLMGLSNQSHALVLSTGNKSEYAQGYCTLYGDMVGGFAPLKDLYKTQVFALARYRNEVSYCIPEGVITRPPTAELAPGQRDEDDLPAYALLDAILHAYLEQGVGETRLKTLYPGDVVEQVLRRLYRNEYKRRQAPLGPVLSSKPFERGRRYPVAQGWR